MNSGALLRFLLVVREFQRDTINTMSFRDLISILASVSFSLKHMTLFHISCTKQIKVEYQMASTICAHNFNSFHPPRFILESFYRTGNPTVSGNRINAFQYPSAKAGQPHPESNFVALLYNGAPHAAQSYTPSPLKRSYFPVPALSVPFSRRIRN